MRNGLTKKAVAMVEGLRNGRSTHRATYILECGTWRATCRECGWSTSDAQRRRAATLFRVHIQDAREIRGNHAAAGGAELDSVDSADLLGQAPARRASVAP
jgi:hypothetical protein